MRRLAEGPVSWGLPIFVMGEFLRVVTHPRVLDPPTNVGTAIGVLEGLLQSRSVQLLIPGRRYWEILRDVVRDAKARGNLVHDAEIVAVCMEHGADAILTEDRDFLRFPSVSIRRLATS